MGVVVVGVVVDRKVRSVSELTGLKLFVIRHI